MQLVRLIVHFLQVFASVPLQADDGYATAAMGIRHTRNTTISASHTGSDYAANATQDECEAVVVPIGFNKIKLTPRPIGNCAYCCRWRQRRDVHLRLYTRRTPPHGMPMRLRRGAARRAGLDRRHPTVVFVHGFIEVAKEASSSYTIRDAYLSRPEPYNVIIVDWTNLSAGPWYGQAAENTVIVSDMLAKFLRMSCDNGDLAMDKVHLIGFSLGAQVVGMVGKHLQRLKSPVGRITGLDPARPLYPENDLMHRITKDDAVFVDVVHTSPLLLGYPVSIGHADFYVNAGRDFQPGCTFEELILQNKIDDWFSCSHQRAWNAYAETIRNPHLYPAYRCGGANGHGGCHFADSYMGFNVSRTCSGDYYVNTEGNREMS